MKIKIEEFITDVKPEMDILAVKEFSKAISKEAFLVSSILLGFTVIGTVMGTIIGIEVQNLSPEEIPFYFLGLIPWLTGTFGGGLGGLVIYRWRGPKVRSLFKRFFGSDGIEKINTVFFYLISLNFKYLLRTSGISTLPSFC